MNENTVKGALVIISSAAVVTLAVRSIVHTHRIEAAKRAVIEEDMHLDIAAINRAAAVVNAQIENGAIRNPGQLVDAVRTEIEFQKIAIREEG